MFTKRINAFFLKRFIKGDNVTCPICEKSFVTFLPFGDPLRMNARCPSCQSLERHRMLYLFLQQKTDFFSQKHKVLHVAPEKRLMKRFQKMANLEYITGDKFEGGFDHSYSKDVVYLDLMNISFEENSFDIVLCSHVLEHIPDDITAMKEIFRVLKPGGWAILQVPLDEERSSTFEDFSITDPVERKALFGQHDHVRVYGRDYADRLQNAGFQVDIIDFFNTFSKEDQTKFGLIKDDIYLCQKKKNAAP